jgi:quercetin dioxygenase-like cupin family protein
MTAPDNTEVGPIALREDEGEAIWFLGHLLTIKASGDTTGGRLAVIENLASQGPASPLHVHRNEDEWFYVIEGELTFWVGGSVIVAPKGSFVFAPRGIPHTFDVSSPQARFLLGAQPAGFEDFVRKAGSPAEALELPPPPGGPPDFARLTALAAEQGIEILGPPGIPE